MKPNNDTSRLIGYLLKSDILTKFLEENDGVLLSEEEDRSKCSVEKNEGYVQKITIFVLSDILSSLPKKKLSKVNPMSTPQLSLFRLDERRTDLSIVDVNHFIFDKYTSTMFSEIGI